MDFDFTEEQMMFRNSVRSFANKEIAPLVEEYEKRQEFPIELFRKMGALGYLCVTFPPEYGGAGAGLVDECILVEELARINSGIAGSIMVQGGIGSTIILDYGNEDQKQRYIVPAIRGEKIGAFGLTEPEAGSDAAAIQTRAEKAGDYYIINGSKIFISNGPICDFVLVAAWTDRSRKPTDGISVIVVDRGTPGFSVSRKLDKVGAWTAETGELVFEDCRVPRENLIGEEGKGLRYLLRSLNRGRITHAASSVGAARTILEEALKYSRERVQFGRPIGKNQSIAFKLARMAMETEAASLLTYHAAWLYDQGRKCSKEASMAKLFASEARVKASNEAMHIFGGYGYMMEYPVQRYWRDAKLSLITEGTSEIQQIIIAREIGLL